MDRSRTPVLALTLALGAILLVSSASPSARAQAIGGPTMPILDDFNRPDEEPLSGGGTWARTDLGLWSALRLGSNAARRSTLTPATSASYWTQDSFAGGTGSVWAKWDGIGPYTARVSIALFKDVGGSSAVDGYELARDRGLFFGNERDTWRLWRFDNGVRTLLATTPENPPTAGYRYFNLQRHGDALEGWVSPDGQNWVLVVEAADSTYPTGRSTPRCTSTATRGPSTPRWTTSERQRAADLGFRCRASAPTRTGGERTGSAPARSSPIP